MADTIETLLDEQRSFPPSSEFAAQANVKDPGLYAQAAKDPVTYWEGWAKELDWIEPWHTVCEFEAPNAKWFIGGKLNACANCVDRHADGGRRDKRAIVWEGEPGDVRTITYGELKDEVSRIANALKELGVRRGDRVCIYMPMVPELPMTMLAMCTTRRRARWCSAGSPPTRFRSARTTRARA